MTMANDKEQLQGGTLLVKRVSESISLKFVEHEGSQECVAYLC
jgi:hypothetical protein